MDQTGISELERAAVLELRARCSSDPIVFDIGSNKGGWADILVKNVAEMHLFEPNERLLTYTMVKYDYLRNVEYFPCCVGDKNEEVKMQMFTNENNGLSNIFGNKKWEEIPHENKMVKMWTLDFICAEHHDYKAVDIVKIDVEGSEMLVLQGAKELLKGKYLKFIQVEYSEHYPLSGYTFKDVINYLEQFGYKGFSYDGEFKPINAETFVEDYHLENYWFMSYDYTTEWNREFKKNTKGLKFQTVLEIGCFEGLTTNYICDNLLTEGGRVICIDPLTDEYLPGHKDNEMFKGQYERFIRNTAGRPVQLIRKSSHELETIKEIKDIRFGLIYIDGDHTEDGVFQDGVMYWNLLLDTLEEGGYMLFDDYGQSEETKRGIDRFLGTQEGNYHLLVKDYQVLIRRRW